MNSSTILKTINYGKHQTQGDIDGYPPDNVRQVFREYERSTGAIGEGLCIIRKSEESHIAIGKYSELPVRTKQ